MNDSFRLLFQGTTGPFCALFISIQKLSKLCSFVSLKFIPLPFNILLFNTLSYLCNELQNPRDKGAANNVIKL